MDFKLRRWSHYEEHRNSLAEHEIDNARLFFNALKRLSEDERHVLKAKYYDSTEWCNYDHRRDFCQTKRPIKDEIVAQTLNYSSVEAYRRARLKAEGNLKTALQEIQQLIRDQLKMFNLKLGDRLYFVAFGQKTILHEQYILGTELDAKVFHSPEDDDVAADLTMLGFYKAPVTKT